MRIIFVIPQLADGGAERAIITFSNVLVNMGEEVHIVCLNNGAPDYAIDERVNKHVWRESAHTPMHSLEGLRKGVALVLKLQKLSGDVIIPFCLPGRYHVLFWFATVFSKTRIIFAVRNWQKKKVSFRRPRIISKIALILVDGIWIQTEGQREIFPRYLQKKIFEVHNILDSRFLDIPRTGRKKIHNFINVGRIHPQKNQKMLIDAFAKMIARTGDQEATLTIYGKARESYLETETELKDIIKRHHLENRVFLPGRVTDIEKKYEEADVFVFSSDYEGCPNALMEAMAAGLPCVSTDCPTGPSMIIERGKNGLLVPVGDAEAMSWAMEYLMENPQAANVLGTAAKERMKAWGSAEELAEQFLAHLKKICS